MASSLLSSRLFRHFAPSSPTSVLPSLFSRPNILVGSIRPITKTKARRLRKKARIQQLKDAGVWRGKKKPLGYIPKDTPVIRPPEQDLEALDKEDAQILKEKMETQPEVLRHHFNGLVMSDRVKRLFDLNNGSQREVVRVQKQRGMELFQLREDDTGTSSVQIIALTTRIQNLSTHMQNHKKDKSSKRGLDALYVRRRKLLEYLERKDFDSYRRVVKTLGIRR